MNSTFMGIEIGKKGLLSHQHYSCVITFYLPLLVKALILKLIVLVRESSSADKRFLQVHRNRIPQRDPFRLAVARSWKKYYSLQFTTISAIFSSVKSL